MFHNREEAAHKLAAVLKGRALRDPLVLAIPRGGVVTGAILATELGADLDVALARKLRAPEQPELAIGAVSENGHVYLNRYASVCLGVTRDYLTRERNHQMAEISRRKQLFRTIRPQAPVTGRSVIVTDDGIATGSTMIAALQALKAQNPHEVIVAVPVAPADRMEVVWGLCDEFVCLLAAEDFRGVGQFYKDFRQIEDYEVTELLRRSGTAPRQAG